MLLQSTATVLLLLLSLLFVDRKGFDASNATYRPAIAQPVYFGGSRRYFGGNLDTKIDEGFWSNFSIYTYVGITYPYTSMPNGPWCYHLGANM